MSSSPNAGTPCVVVFRGRLDRAKLVGAIVVPTVVLLAVFGAGFAGAGSGNALAGVAGVGVVFAITGVVLWTAVARTSWPHRWDLRQATISGRDRTYRFTEIGRVVLCSGAKGWRGLLFCDRDGNVIRNLSVTTRGTLVEPMGRDQWIAVRALLAQSHAPTFEAFGTIRRGPRDVERRGSKVVLRGAAAVQVVDAQLHWIDSGGAPSSRRAPVDLLG